MTRTHEICENNPDKQEEKLTPSLGNSEGNSGDHKEAEPPTEFSLCAFTRSEKWFIVSLIALAGLFSPLTANIYFPAIPTLSNVFDKSTELINLTVTMYIVLQGLAPMFWGTLSDRWGRRPIYMACLIILSVSCVGLALVPNNAYWLLMLLRCLQATGSASTIAIGAGVIGDISTQAERGGFFGLYTTGPLIGPAIGPVIGGALADHLGWRSIFWFLCIAATLCLVVITLFLPETLRVIVGDGSTPAPWFYRPVIPIIGRNNKAFGSTRQEALKKFKNPFRLLLQLDILNLLWVNALVCAVFYGVLASISTLFTEAYPFLNETKIGLCFLGIGFGMVLGSSTTGKFLDWQYARFKKNSLLEMPRGDPAANAEFPIEKARLQSLPIVILLYTGCSAGYGWCIQHKVNLVGPLILQVFVGFFTISIMNSTSTLMIDLVPKQSSSVTACNNLVRCTLSAVVVAVIDLIINTVGVGWTYVILASFSFISLPFVYLAMRIGPAHRQKR